MGTRPPAEARSLRDYRTLTLPAVQEPIRGPLEEEWEPEDEAPWSATDYDAGGNTARSWSTKYGSASTRSSRTVMAAGRYARCSAGSDAVRHICHIDSEGRRRARPDGHTYKGYGREYARASAAPTPTPLVIAPARPRPSEPRALEQPLGRVRRLAAHAKSPPLVVMAYLAVLVVVGSAIALPSLVEVDAAAGCQWHTVVPNDTLGNLGYFHHTTAMAIARANHIRNPNLIYVGQKLCIPMTSWAQAHSAVQASSGVIAAPIPAAPAKQGTSRGSTSSTSSNAPTSIPPNRLPAGEPCTADRSIVWTIPFSRWTIPPGCFGGIYFPNPNNYRVNGQIIPGFGWCNWWPEALLRDPHAIDRPGHKTPRVGVPVFFAPQPGERVGHYAFVESIGPNGWMLISEMNMYWRGGGWQKVDYRYIRVDYPGATYLYW